MAQAGMRIEPRSIPLLVRVIVLAVALNVMAWIAAACYPDPGGSWALVVLPVFVLLGFIIGRSWALLVTLAYCIIHAIPVSVGLLPGYLSTWGEALWWTFALIVMLVLTGLGVLGRWVTRWYRSRSGLKL